MEMSLIDKFKILCDLIFSSPFFIAFLIITILTVVVLVINIKIKSKKIKIISAISYFFIAIFLIINYGSSILVLSDTLVQKVFTGLYFPNFISYICMLLITAFLLVYVLINDKLSKFIKTSSIFFTSTIIFLFILTLDTITKNNIDISSKVSLYTNESLIALIQTSTAIFAIWLIILVIDKIVSILDGKTKEPTFEDMENMEENYEVVEEEESEVSMMEDQEIIFEDPEKINYQEYIQYFQEENNQ